MNALFINDFLRKPSRHFFSNFFCSPRPNINYLVVSLSIGDQTILMLPIDFVDITLSFPQLPSLFFRNHHVVHTDGKTCLGGIGITKIFKIIQHFYSFNTASLSVGFINQLCHLFFLKMHID